MKNLFIILLITVSANGYCQDLLTFFNKAPKIKATILVKNNDINAFNTKKWYAVKDASIKENIFGIAKNKNTNNETVSNTKFLGWWGIDEANVAFVYAYDVLENSKTVTKIFVSSYLKKGKGVDNDPFNLLPNPIGMQGKITVTQKVVINNFGKITATQTHKSSNGKVLTKTKSFFVNEKGSLQESE